MRFCNQCAAALHRAVPEGDDRPRFVCTSCGHVHYQNPTNVVGCLVEQDGRVLLCRRAIEPAHGRWTIPAGFLELGEGLRAGARRETFEEAGATVAITAPHAYLDLPHLGQCYSFFRAQLTAPEVTAGKESLEVGFYAEDQIPWDDLAFPVVHFALRLWIEDRAAGLHRMHNGVLLWNGSGSRYDPANYELGDYQPHRLG